MDRCPRPNCFFRYRSLKPQGSQLLFARPATGSARSHFAGILEEVKKKYKGKVDVVSIVLPPDTLEMAKKYIDINKTTVPVLFDSGQMSMVYLKVTPQNPEVVFPQLFIVDQQGTIKENFKFANETADFFNNSKQLTGILDKMVK